jgi:hypothetical protein
MLGMLTSRSHTFLLASENTPLNHDTTSSGMAGQSSKYAFPRNRNGKVAANPKDCKQ